MRNWHLRATLYEDCKGLGTTVGNTHDAQGKELDREQGVVWFPLSSQKPTVTHSSTTGTKAVLLRCSLEVRGFSRQGLSASGPQRRSLFLFFTLLTFALTGKFLLATADPFADKNLLQWVSNGYWSSVTLQLTTQAFSTTLQVLRPSLRDSVRQPLLDYSDRIV